MLKNIKTASLFISVLSCTTADATLTIAGAVNPISPGPNDAFYIGNNGVGSLLLNSNATGNGITVLPVGNTYVGNSTGASNGDGEVNITGDFSVLLTKELRVGTGGSSKGTINISDGGYVASLNNAIKIGDSDSGTGTVTVDGISSFGLRSELNSGAEMYVGYKGKKGELFIKNGGISAVDGNITVGYGVGNPSGKVTEGFIKVEGSAAGGFGGITRSELYNINDLIIGYGTGGSGTIEAADGAKVRGREHIYAGYLDGGKGVLNIHSGSIVETKNITLGGFGSATGEVIVKGNDSSLHIFQDYRNGNEGTGTTTITDGGKIDIDNDFFQNNQSQILFGLSATYLTTGNWAIDVLNDASLAGGISLFSDGTVIGTNQEYLFMNVGNQLNGGFAGLAQDDWVTELNGIGVFISYSGGDGNDIVFYTKDVATEPPNGVPEPMSFMLSSMGMLFIGGRIGRRARG